jgi:hypothetical protein
MSLARSAAIFSIIPASGNKIVRYYFTDANEIGAFGPAFLRLMFAHAELERRVGHLQQAITGKPNGQLQWSARGRPNRIKRLVRENRDRLGELPMESVEAIAKALRRAIVPSDLRNLLAHGHWWQFDSADQIMTIRREKMRPGQELHIQISVSDINHAEIELTAIEIELYEHQKTIETSSVNPAVLGNTG